MDSVLNRPLFAGKVSADPSGAIMRQYQQRSIRPAGLPSLSGTKSEAMAADRAVLFSNALLAAAEEKVRMAQDRFENDPSGVNQQRYVDAVSQLEAAQKESEDVMSTYVPSPITSIRDRGVLDVEGPEAVVSQMTPEQLDIFNDLDRAANNPIPDMFAPEGPSGMEREAQGSRLSRLSKPFGPFGPSGMETEARSGGPRAAINPAPDVPAPDVPAPKVAVPGSPILGRSTMEADARDRGPLISNPLEVATGLNAEDPAVRERTLKDFMKEFTDAAPKYEGPDKGLLLAQIGFAIAAGESPNAMQNIANGLLVGSDMMIKDKAAKDEFNRQIQLSAMQYGLAGKAQDLALERELASEDRALGRELAKEDRALGRQFTDYVASKEVTYRGTKYGPNESIPVLHSDIIGGNMPDGVVSESLSNAMTVNNTALRKALIEAEENQTLSPEQYRASIEEVDAAASSFSAARNLIPLIESSILRNADGEVTGLRAAATKAINQFANAVGVDLGAQYQSKEAYDSAMKNVAVQMVQDLLGESGKTISDADRQLIDRLVGLQADIMSGVLSDKDVINSRLQEILKTAESKQQSALDTYGTLMEGLGGTLTPSGTSFRSLKAERVFNPSEPERAFTYNITEDGKYVRTYLGGGE